MRHVSKRRHHRSLAVERLEDRLQPGTILTIDMGLNESLTLATLDVPSGSPSQSASIRRLCKHGDTEIGAPAGEHGIGLASMHSMTSTTVQRNASVPLSIAKEVSNPRFIPAFHARESMGSQNSSQPTMAHEQRRELHKVPVRAEAVRPTARDIGPLVNATHIDVSKFQPVACEGVDTKAAVYNTYFDNGVSSASTNAVAAGRGGNLGKAFAAGSRGLDGAITRYSSSGACEFNLPIPDPTSSGKAVVITDIAAVAGAVVAVGNVGATEAIVLRLDPFSMAVTDSFLYTEMGVTYRFEGTAFSLNGNNPDIFITGTVNDPALNGYDNMFVSRYDPGLTAPVYETAIDFDAASHGFAVDADRPEHAYIGGNFVRGGPIENVTLRLNNNGVTIPWAYYLWYDPTSYVNPTNGIFGVKVVGGTSAAGGLYTTGNLQVDSLNPPGPEPAYQNTVLAKWDLALGIPVDYGFMYYSDGVDYTGEDVVADRDGNAYKIGSVGDSNDRDAVLDKFDATGAVYLAGDFVGGVDTQDLGKGVDLVINSDTSDVISAGQTTTPALGLHPTPAGCDVSYNGGADGFVAKLLQPLG